MSKPGTQPRSCERNRPGTNRDHPVAVPPGALSAAVERAGSRLLHLQQPDGHWCGELRGDTTVESAYILLMTFLGREQETGVARAARYLVQQQMPEGGWNTYPGGPVDVSASVRAYFALKLAGHDPESPCLRRARAVIRALGGAAACNSFTKFYLALLGQFPYANCPAVPPEMMFLPRWAYVNLYAMSSWTRAMVVPLSILYACKPARPLPPERGIAELFLAPPQTPQWSQQPTPGWLSWGNFFLVLDHLVKWLDRWLPPRRVRAAAVARAERWLLAHFADSDGVGAIFPSMVYTIIALRCLGYADDSPEMRYALGQLDGLKVEDGQTLRLQPSLSPVWDTALSLHALDAIGIHGNHDAMARASRWLLEREVRRPGDWSVTNPHLAPGGWCFQYRNGFYPDMDDTAIVLMVLALSGQTADPAGHAATQRAIRWLFGMQNKDGGWAAFDRDNDHEILNHVPFADHNAMLDRSCPDITARVLEALGLYGFAVGHPRVDRAVAYLRAHQDPRGCWPGRWGVNYLYGTWRALHGLRAVHFDMQDDLVQRAARWLCRVQQPGGGWGETCRSYDDPALAGQGTVTASQTAWAVLALIAAGQADSAAARAGIAYLLEMQQPAGDWHEEPFTGTGFPKVFYLRYPMYPLYFPLLALGRYAREVGIDLQPHDAGCDSVVSLRRME